MTKGKKSSANLRLLESSLGKRQEKARRFRKDETLQAEELWQVWQNASQFAALARVFWPAGRDATLTMLKGEDREGACTRLGKLLAALQRFDLVREASICCDRAVQHLSDAELSSIFEHLDPTRQLARSLSVRVRTRVIEVARAAYVQQPLPSIALLLGRMLEASDQEHIRLSTDYGNNEERSLEARALRHVRSYGTETAAGVTYEAQYTLWRVLTEPDIVEVQLQDLEDIALVHTASDGQRIREHVQTKKKDSGWSIPDLQGKDSQANKVFDSFAKVLLAESEAWLTFASDNDLTRGSASDLKRVAATFRDISPDPDTLRNITLSQVSISKGQQGALEQLAKGMDPDLLTRIDLRRLLARVVFDVGRTRRELRSETIRAISARMSIPDREAEDAYKAAIGGLVLEMETRRPLSRDDVLNIIDRMAVTTGAFHVVAHSGGHVELLDFDGVDAESASADRYYQGLSTSVADVAAGFDALRPAMLTEIARLLDDRRCCIIRGVSGQGKTTLLYRYAYEVREEMIVVRVHGLDHGTTTELLRLVDPSVALPILVLVDDIARGDRTAWPGALRRLLECVHITVLATSREDDWKIGATSTLESLVGFAYPQLDEHTAEVIFQGLQSIKDAKLHAEHWREPFEQAGGLLMEYVHLLTQGRHMRDVIADQIRQLENNLGLQAVTTIEALRYIATAHSYGGYLSRKTLSVLVKDSGLGRALATLEAEFLIRATDFGRYFGLHPVRSQIVTEVLHEHDELNDTLERLLALADANEVGAMLEELLYQLIDDRARPLVSLAERIPREDARFGLRVATAAYAAAERRYANGVFSLLLPPRQHA